MIRDIGDMVRLFWRTLQVLPLTFRQSGKVLDQLYQIGAASLFIACLLSFSIGGVIGLQTGPVLRERGLVSALGGLVGLSICKELAPVMMAILVAGRVGSAMAAEIGSMAVYQEIDALKTLNISPVTYLVLPRLVAISIALPLLVVVSTLAGWTGGAMVAFWNEKVRLAFPAFFSNLREMVEVKDIMNGLCKSFVFAVGIGVICCQQGLATRGGPRGIGRSVTKSVVNSLVFILLLDYVLTRLLLNFDK